MSTAPPTSFLPFRKMPGPGQQTPWTALGRQIELDRDPIRFMQKIRAQYGNLVRYQSLFGDEVFAFGPDNNRELHRNTDLFYSRPFVLKGPRESSQTRLRASIFNLNVEKHQEMRHHLLPPFQRTSLSGYYDDVVNLVRIAMSQWQPETLRDMHQEMHLLVWNIVRQLLYGMEDGEASEALHDRLEHWMFQTFSPWVRSFQINLPFTPFRRMLREGEALEKQFLKIMRDRREKGASGNDALSTLLRIRLPNGEPMPLDALVGHVLTLFLVAYETTGNTLTWTLFLLSQHPQVQQDLLDELAPLQGAAPAAKQLDSLPLLDHVLKESMRLLPAVPYNRRMVSRDGSLGDYALPKGARIIFSHYITHHMPEIYSEPERFLPERWDTISPSPAEYLPFGAGVRTCLGVSLAPFVIKIALSMILPKWKLSMVPGATIDRQTGISLGPKNGLPMMISRQDRRLEAAPVLGNIHEMVDLNPQASTTAKRRAA